MRATRVADGIWVGSDQDVPLAQAQGKAIVTLAKHGPYGHAKTLGYGSGAAPQGPERLWAVRGDHLITNAVDSEAGHPDSYAIFDEAVRYALAMKAEKKDLLIHCNQGQSRAPSVAVAVLMDLGLLPKNLFSAITEFKKLYPSYAPRGGVMDWLKRRSMHHAVSS